jgi:hypothetical protein
MAEESVSRQIEKYFATAEKQLNTKVKEITKKHARKLRLKIMADSPVDTTSVGEKVHGVYKNGWRVTTNESIYGIECVVRQYRRPSLTWLLENGHLLTDGMRTRPQPHIEQNGDNEAELWTKELTDLELDL